MRLQCGFAILTGCVSSTLHTITQALQIQKHHPGHATGSVVETELGVPRQRLDPKPIQFAIPTATWKRTTSLRSIPLKQKKVGFAPLVPGMQSTYVYRSEQAYYQQYQDSLFGITRKKAGWDCMRHYEIILSGAIPYFIGIDRIPQNTMVTFPRGLVRKAMKLAGVPRETVVEEHLRNGTIPEIDFSVFDYVQYSNIRDEILSWASNNLLASHTVAKIVPSNGTSKVFVHSSCKQVGYQTVTLIIGLVENGHEVYVKPSAAAAEVLFQDFKGHHDRFYGHGFTYGHTLTRSQLMTQRKMRDTDKWDYYILIADCDNPWYPTPDMHILQKSTNVIAVDGNDSGPEWRPPRIPTVADQYFLREL